MKEILYKNRISVGLILILFSYIFNPSFKQIFDVTKLKRKSKVEYIVVHWTANTNPRADAIANARYLQKKQNAGTHYCIDDVQIVQCTPEDYVAYAVGDNKWLGFVTKFWLKDKIKNGNSLSYEMCLGGGRNDSTIMDVTAQCIGWQLVNKGLDISRVVRHYDVSGKHCPRFNYNDKEWDLQKENESFDKFKKIVEKYYKLNLERVKK